MPSVSIFSEDQLAKNDIVQEKISGGYPRPSASPERVRCRYMLDGAGAPAPAETCDPEYPQIGKAAGPCHFGDSEFLLD
jgi:hypothetical protein